MSILSYIKNGIRNVITSGRVAREIRDNMQSQSVILQHKLTELLDEVRYLTHLVKNNPSFELVSDNSLTETMPDINNGYQAPPAKSGDGTEVVESNSENFNDALKQHPLKLARKTYNSHHPDYNVELARNFPGKIFHMQSDAGNPVYAELKKMIKDNEIAELQWQLTLRKTLEEARTVPHANEIFERKAFVEKYLEDLETKHGAYYKPGWVNLDDALFLYWVVRKLNPKTIVQTGVCNGLSSAFMMLALAKNGSHGKLHVVDMPPVFDSSNPNWTIRGKVYGVVIPEGNTSGWLVPDAYRDRFEVLNGDAKDLLPTLLKKLGSIDMFYHDSDHTYDHMMFEFIESKKYLTQNGVVVSDDISWNSSLWDFADNYLAPAYNYRGSMGIVCF